MTGRDSVARMRRCLKNPKILPRDRSALTARRGQILGLAPREDWRGWERIEAYLPQSERQDLIAEIRGLTQGLGAFEADFDHMAELHGRLAELAAQASKPAAAAH